ncbi:MAG: SDR family oxidoreductase [Chloroflexi bacterium]|nr:SDR family oxidoreductase [Chloroflexota bacterium]
MMRLENKIAVITGASRGIGEAIALGYVREGATVVIASRKQDALDEVAATLREAGGQVLTVATHTGDESQCKNLIACTVEAYGRVDILVNNAATNPHFGPIMTAEASHWQKILEVNLLGYFNLCKYAAEAMATTGGGKIVNMASVAGINPAPMMGVYSVSKAAVIMLTQSLAMELGANNIQVNAIAPGVIKTKFAAALWGDPTISQRYTDRTPAGRIGEPEDIVQAAIYLASAGSSYMTGQVLVLDGGNSVTGF